MSLLSRLPITLAVAFSNHIAWTSPNPAPSKEELDIVPTERKFSALYKYGPWIAKGPAWAAFICETAAATVLIPDLPQSLLHTPLLSLAVALPDGGNPRRIAVTSLFLLGGVLASFGAFIRLRCYSTLQQMFTHELGIVNDHKLVTTGPYSIVRHPSYTGAVLVFVGTLLVHLTPGSWVRESGFLNTTGGRYFTTLWTLFMFFSMVKLVSRPSYEDRMLKDKFGPEWEAYAEKVPGRLIPWIY